VTPRRLPLAAVALALALASCHGEPRPSVTESPIARADDPALDEVLLVPLAQARNLHHLADLHLADADLEAAIGAVAAVLRVRFPAGSPEGEDTLLDARARLAKLLVTAGRPDEARRVVDEGLAAAARESFFLANLHAVSGELHQARARALEESDPAAARAERRRAIEAIERSMEINERIQQRLWKEIRR
jgi:hypothetical protein